MASFFVLLLCFSGLVSFVTDAAAHDTSDLNLDPAAAPYQTKLIKAIRHKAPQPGLISYLMADLEGDGQLEMISGETSRLMGWDCEDGYIKPRFQYNLEPGWRFHHHGVTHLGVTSDFNHDNIAEVHVTIRTFDRSAWRFQTFDLATGEVTLDVPLPLGEDRRADGVWDGSYMAIGMLTDADGQGTPGVVLLRNAGYDANPRGVAVLNAHTGELIWEWQCGPNPNSSGYAVTDLDGDGREEIVLFGHSPDNLGGVQINGTSDDHAYLFVLSSTGEELWREELGGIFCAGEVVVADLDGDERPEIITHTSVGRIGQTNKLTIWDFASRRRVAMQRREASFSGLAVLPGPQAGTSCLISGSNDGYITQYLFAERKLVKQRRRLVPDSTADVIGAVDILPEPGREVLVDLEGRVFLVLDGELNPLAVYDDGEQYPKGFPVLWERMDRNLSLVVGSDNNYHIFEFVRKAYQVPMAAKMVGALILLVALLGITYRFGRTVGKRDQDTVVPDVVTTQVADREILYRLWRQLDDVKHERFLEANRGLRRLVWLLEAYAADLGASATLGVRIGQLLDDFNDSVQPRLAEILYLAESEKFEIDSVRETARALAKLGGHLGQLNVETLTVESVQACGSEMNQELGRIEAGFLHLWQALRQYFSTDPVRMIQGMLLVREVEFQRAGIGTELVGAAAVTEPLCLIDGSSLRFLLENLVDNAFRAMAEAPDKNLRVEVKRSETEVILKVIDTGKGIASDLQDEIFNGRTSDRAGGGAGLFRTREILQKWRGEIKISESAPGQGTTFVVKLRAAHTIDAAAKADKKLRGAG